WRLPVGGSGKRLVSEAALRGRIGAYKLHATHDPRETTQRARAAFLSRFEAVDPDGVLPEAERLRRAAYARKAYFAQLALKSVRRRAKRQRPPVQVKQAVSRQQAAELEPGAEIGAAESSAAIGLVEAQLARSGQLP